MRSRKPTRPAFAYDALDSVIHERARLSLLTCLVTHPKGLAFADLKAMCALTDGNLSRHLQVLRTAKLIEITKDADHSRPHTFFAGQPMLRSMIWAPSSTLARAASASACASAPASCTTRGSGSPS